MVPSWVCILLSTSAIASPTANLVSHYNSLKVTDTKKWCQTFTMEIIWKLWAKIIHDAIMLNTWCNCLAWLLDAPFFFFFSSCRWNLSGRFSVYCCTSFLPLSKWKQEQLVAAVELLFQKYKLKPYNPDKDIVEGLVLISAVCTCQRPLHVVFFVVLNGTYFGFRWGKLRGSFRKPNVCKGLLYQNAFIITAVKRCVCNRVKHKHIIIALNLSHM